MADEVRTDPPAPETQAPPVVETPAPEPEAPAPELAVDEDDPDFDPVKLVRTSLGYEQAFPDGADKMARHLTAERIKNLPPDARAAVVNMAARMDRMEREIRTRFEKDSADAKAAADKRAADLDAQSQQLSRREAAFRQVTADPKLIERLRSQIAAKPAAPDATKPEDVKALAEAAAAEVALNAIERQEHIAGQLAANAERDNMFAEFGIRPGTDESKAVNALLAQMYGTRENIQAFAAKATKREETPLYRALTLWKTQNDAAVAAKAAADKRAGEAADRRSAAAHVATRPGPQAAPDLQSVWDRYVKSDPRLDKLTYALSGEMGADLQRAAKAYSRGELT